MLSTILSTALLGASAVFAAPASQPGSPPWHGHGGAPPSSSGQVAFKFPLANGFPNIQIPSAALTAIEQQAHGTLPNGALPKSLASGDVTTFELIVTNELFEVAFFTSLIQNITNNVAGFEIPSAAVKNFVLEALTAVQAQEELHALGANGILTSAGATAIQPCEYVFPSDTFDSAIDFARTFTDVVLGTLQDAQAGLNANGDGELIPLVASIIGQEGEQNGYYRSLLNLVPSESPFLTRSTGPWAYSVLNQNVLVKGTCPNANIINIPIFGALALDTPAPIQLKDQTLEFTFTNNGTNVADSLLVYINGQNVPVIETPQNIQTKGDSVSFQAQFPAATNIMDGLTIAVLTDNSVSAASSADQVAAATLFGPALIEIN